MSAMIQRDSVEKSEKTPLPSSSVEDEKHVAVSETDDSVNDGDEALHLVGRERTEEFSEEYNKRLRKKLVRA
jgi:MFS transporter, ACS family, allantoate permease